MNECGTGCAKYVEDIKSYIANDKKEIIRKYEEFMTFHTFDVIRRTLTLWVNG